ELDDAAATLEQLRQRDEDSQIRDDAHIRLRALRLAARRGAQSDAMEMLEEYASDEDAPAALFREAIDAMEGAGWAKAVDRVLEQAIAQEGTTPLAGRFWVERRLAHDDHSCVQRFDELLARGMIGEQAVVAYLEGLGQNKDAVRLQPFVEEYSSALR